MTNNNSSRASAMDSALGLQESGAEGSASMATATPGSKPQASAARAPNPGFGAGEGVGTMGGNTPRFSAHGGKSALRASQLVARGGTRQRPNLKEIETCGPIEQEIDLHPGKFRFMGKRVPPILWITLLWWAGFSLVFAIQSVRMKMPDGTAISWEIALEQAFGGWMSWVPITLGMYWLVRRFPFERTHLVRSIAVHGCAVAAAITLRACYVYATNSIFNWYPTELPKFTDVLEQSEQNNFLLACVVIGMLHAFVYYDTSREREKRVNELEANLAISKLAALRAQINPHFLFNSLNSVAEIVHVDSKLADQMLVSLAALLRDSLGSGHEQVRTMLEELELVEHYLMIEKIRLGDRLTVGWNVDDRVEDIVVPALILQPIVENAIVHGISLRRTPGLLSINVEIIARHLEIVVENSRAEGVRPEVGNGIALESTRTRLNLLYGDAATLEQRVSQDGSTYQVLICIPVDADVQLQGGGRLVA